MLLVKKRIAIAFHKSKDGGGVCLLCCLKFDNDCGRRSDPRYPLAKEQKTIYKFLLVKGIPCLRRLFKVRLVQDNVSKRGIQLVVRRRTIMKAQHLVGNHIHVLYLQLEIKHKRSSEVRNHLFQFQSGTCK